MPDEVNAKDKGGNFSPHDEGQFAARCVDTINLGQRIEQFPGQPARVVDKAAVVFVTDSEGETKEIAIEFTVSMNRKANLRKFLESWRGKSYTEEQAVAGIPLHKLVGQGALLSIEHHTATSSGRTYGKIASIAPLPKSMPAPGPDGYKRPEYWAEKKKKYADEAAQWAANQARLQGEPPLDESQAQDDDDLPF